MKDTSGIYYRRGHQPVSLLWHFGKDGTPLALSILPHDLEVSSRLVVFDSARKVHVIEQKGVA